MFKQVVGVMILAATTCCCVDQALAVELLYDVEFVATWSSESHPGSYPSSAHFSPLWLASHNEGINFWEIGGVASDGIEQMAETGGISRLNSQFDGAMNTGNVAVRQNTSGLPSPSSVETSIFVSTSHPLVTAVTMVAPSPDWFVGVDSLSLWDGDRWIESLTVDLFAYDAGTDNGTSFRSPNSDTNPREPIALLGAPLAGTPALGTLTFTRKLPIPGDTNGDGIVDIVDLNNVRGNWGGTGEGDTYPFDGIVDLLDLNAVRNNFGRVASAVPEPSSGAIAAIASIVVLGLSRFRRTTTARSRRSA